MTVSQSFPLIKSLTIFISIEISPVLNAIRTASVTPLLIVGGISHERNYSTIKIAGDNNLIAEGTRLVNGTV